MLNLNLTVKDNHLRKLESELRHLPDKVNQVLAESVNSTMAEVQTTIIDAVTDTYIIDRGVVEDTISTGKATSNNPNARLRSYGPAIGLREFEHTPEISTKVKPAIGVHVRVRRDSAGKSIPGTFMAEMKSGHIGVFVRSRNATRRPADNTFGFTTLPIKEPKGPAVPLMISKVIDERQIEAKATKLLEKAVDAALDVIFR